jgi:single-strand DNA-binding protein
MNIITLIGRVGKDPEVKTFESGNKIAQFSLATSEKWKDKATGEKKERTQWHQIKVQGDGLVGVIEAYVSKGDMLAVTGALEYRQWEKDGAKMTAAEIVVGIKGAIELLGGKQSERSNDDHEKPKPSAPQKTFAHDLEDDIPFDAV